MEEKVLSLDVTLTGAMIGVVTEDGNLVFGEKVVYKSTHRNEIAKELKDLAIDLLEKHKISLDEITRVAIDVPGFVDHNMGIVKLIPSVNFADWDLKSELVKLFPGKEVYVLNDAFAAALGEFWVGTGVQYDSILFYTIDSSIGGAIINRDKLIIGSRGFAGQFGHGINVGDNGKLCKCGYKGCLSAICSEQGIKEQIIEQLKTNANHPAAFYFHDIDLDKIDSGVIYDIYKKNNEPREIYDLMRTVLKPLLKHMMAIYCSIDPDAIIFSGSVARLDDFLIKIIRDAIKEYTIERFSESAAVEQSALGPDAAMVGAAYYALQDSLVD
jgi:glucokinase